MVAVSDLKRKLIVIAAAVGMPLLVFGLPVLATYCLGPNGSDALGNWLASHAGSTGCGSAHQPGRAVPAFRLTDQEGRIVASETLRGNVWVASFFLSQCAGTCLVSVTMSRARQSGSPLSCPCNVAVDLDRRDCGHHRSRSDCGVGSLEASRGSR